MKEIYYFFFSNIDKQLFNELSFSLSRILNVNAYYFISINKIMNMFHNYENYETRNGLHLLME